MGRRYYDPRSTYKLTHIYKRGPDKRTRFHHGFCDGVAAVRFGWAFYDQGDPVYTLGWKAGHAEATLDLRDGMTSDGAWREALTAGLVSE
jgi:hypothetical protein